MYSAKLAIILSLTCSAYALDVSAFPGDWCAKVNAGDAALGTSAGELAVPSSLSGTCATTIRLSSNHKLVLGPGTFNLGLLSARAGIVIGHGVSNIAIVGSGIGVTTLQYTSSIIALGQGGNAFPWGSAIGLGTVTQCLSPADASSNIRIEGITLDDLNTGSSLGSTHNPSAIDGACVNNLSIVGNEFTDIKGNAAITVIGAYGGGGGSVYYSRENIFDGTTTGGGGEFNADNSSNWTHLFILNNTVSDYPCGVGLAHAFQGVISGNTLDMTQKAAYGNCSAIGLGSGDATIGDLQATNNVITLNGSSSPVGIGIFPADAIGNGAVTIIGNTIHQLSSGSITGISINGTSANHNPPDEIVRGNIVVATYPTVVTGVLGNVEVSDNLLEGSTNIALFNCATAAVSIQSASIVRVFNNRSSGVAPVTSCTDPSFSSRFIQLNNN